MPPSYRNRRRRLIWAATRSQLAGRQAAVQAFPEHQGLGAGDAIIMRQLPGMQIHCPHYPPQSPQHLVGKILFRGHTLAAHYSRLGRR